MKKAIIVFATFGMLASACTSETTSNTNVSEPVQTKITDVKTKAVLVYADWCGSCKILDPKLKSVRSAHQFDGVDFVVLDYTNKDVDAFYAAAAKAGVEQAIRTELDGTIKTGILLLVDADDNKVIGKVTKALSENEITTEINSALSRS